MAAPTMGPDAVRMPPMNSIAKTRMPTSPLKLSGEAYVLNSTISDPAIDARTAEMTKAITR